VQMSETPRRAHSGRRLVALAAAIALIAAVGVVLLQNARDDETGIRTTPDTETSVPDPATIPTDPSDEVCPLTAEAVSQVIGETFTGPESSSDCTFETGTGAFPGVSFEYLPPSACTPERLRPEEYSARASAELGVAAYSTMYSLGVLLIACHEGQPFHVVVDGADGDDLTFAIALASLVLDS
jgi:hypothetical protein